MEGDLFDTLLTLGGGGPGARVRRWSLVLLALSTVVGLFGAYTLLRNTPTDLDVARIEDGYSPFVGSWIGDRHFRPNPYRISGHLVTSDAVVVTSSRSQRICAPIVSERPGAMDHPPRVLFMAYTAEYDRARVEGRFVGDLTRGLDPETRLRFQAQGITVDDDVLLLRNIGRQAIGAVEGATLVTIAIVLALLGLGGLLYARGAGATGRESAP
jgi:hypothetical protein